ncbi:MAG: 5'-nucleotidase C-terminal domain-containing protein [Candidatus Eisenbacteria bacterium]
MRLRADASVAAFMHLSADWIRLTARTIRAALRVAAASARAATRALVTPRGIWASAALALSLGTAAALAPPARAEDARLVILHTTDLHGAFDGWDYSADRPEPHGLTRIATLVRRARAEGSPTLVLDAGDCIQGGAATIFARRKSARPHPMMSLMNSIGYDAMAVGNHEFDFGREGLARIRKQAKFPWLAANVVRRDGRPAFDASLVRIVGGIKVGIVGLCTPAVPMFTDSVLWAGLRFVEPIEPARREVERLRKIEHCDVVVLLAHMGLERDPATQVSREGETPDENWGYRLAEQVRGVDAVILGHTHAVVPSARVNGTLVTQAGKHGESLGRIEIPLSRTTARAPWVVGEIRARVHAVTDTVAEDSALAARATGYRNEARAALATIVGSTARPLSAPAGRTANSTLWQLIHNVQLAASGADVSLAALPEPEVVIPAGPITERDLLRLYPYENTLGMVQLTGGELKQVLEKSAGFLNAYDFEHDRPLFAPGAPGYNFDMAAGVEYVVDATRPVGDRIVNLRFQGAPLDPSRTLRVAVNSYREFGGGGFPAIRTAPRLWQSKRTVRELIAESLLEHPTLDAASLAGWTLRPAHAARPERAQVDRMVRSGVIPRDEVLALDGDRPVTRHEFLTWLSRAMGATLAPLPLARSGPDDRAVTLSVALEQCEKVARAARYTLAARSPDASFRRSLLTGTSFLALAGNGTGPAAASLTAPQALAIIGNLRYPTLQVLETTDFHGAILQGSRDRATDRPVGGSVTLAAWVEKLRAENPEGTVLLDGGDWYQGTMISNLQFGRPVIQQMNAMGYAAAAIGNHEFDWNADTLQRRVAELRCAALGANMVERRTGRRPRWARADTVFTRRGVKVGVMGFCYRFTPTVTLGKYVAHLRFDDDSTTAARLMPALKRRSDVVIGVGHVPAEVDSARRVHGDLPRLARIPGFDLVLGGHSHNQVMDRVGEIPVMISGSHGAVLGVCELVVDGLSRKVIERHTRLQPTFQSEVAPDSAMSARIAVWNANVGPIAGQFLCRNARRLGRNRNGESALGSLVADAMRAEVKADVALQNSGGLRADLAEGEVTRGSIYEVMPFDNTLVTMELTGAKLRQAFEDGLAFGRVPQISGVRISFDLSRPRGKRLVMLAQADGQPLDPTYHYRVVVNNFMAGGGDNYDSLAKGRNLTDTGMNVRDAFERYVVEMARTNGGVLDYKGDGRIRRSGAPAAEGKR